jgi:hypothetical protein
MKPYIFAECYDEALENLIEKDRAKPLIEEMFYQYGLKVMHSIPLLRVKYGKDVTYTSNFELATSVDNISNAFILTLDGLPYCAVYVAELDKPTYCYYTLFYHKDRAKYGNDDRGTLRSIHIDSLLKNIDKNKAMPCDQDIIDYTTNQLYPLLNEMFDSKKELYMIGNYYGLKGYTIGKIKAYNSKPKSDYDMFEIADLFHRVTDIQNHEDKDILIPKLTMLKVYLDTYEYEREDIFLKAIHRIPTQLIELDAIVASPPVVSVLSCAWTILPTGD